MKTPSTRVQVLIVWTVICGAAVAGLAMVAATPLPDECFECGLPQQMAEIAMTVVLILWAIVAVTLWVWPASPD